MASEAAVRTAPSRGAPFAPYHRWDRNFFLALVAFVWLGIAMGFGGDIADHIRSHAPGYPLIVHLHAVAFVGWLVLLTTQVLLIRTKRLALHMSLGTAAMGLAAIMVVIGPATAIYMQRLQFGTPDSDPSFVAIQFTDIIAFATLVTAGFVLRSSSSAHKRLMLLATLYISDAGFARWLAHDMHGLLGGSYAAFVVSTYFANDLLILSLGGYDLITRGRLHPAYIWGAAWAFSLQLLAGYLYVVAPFWPSLALHLIGH